MNPRTGLIIGISSWVGPLLLGAAAATLIAIRTQDGPRVGLGNRDDNTRLPTPSDRDRLQGPWVAVSVEREGMPIYHGEEATKAQVTFLADEVTFIDGDVTLRGTFHLDPNSSPKAFDQIALEGGWRRTYPTGFYSLEDTTFRLCFAFPDGIRPTRLATEPDSGQTLFVYQWPGMERVVGRQLGPQSMIESHFDEFTLRKE